ncbi:MAG: hypothetical protein M0Q92_08830 [Methanoregula sp.]|jgi:hypothetical protein|nr:hypothetical protein [Methanoregula sp.]
MEFTPAPLPFFKNKKSNFLSNKTKLNPIKIEIKKFTSHNTAHAVQKFFPVKQQGMKNFLTQIALTIWQV